jgi:hypothetical protein
MTVINSKIGIFEFGSVIFWVINCGVSFRLTFKFKKQMMRKVVFMLFTIFYFLCIGEDSNWGQDYFNVQTLDIMLKYNVEKENNFHNCIGYYSDHLFVLGLFTLCFVMPLIARFNIFYRKLFDYLGVPIASPGLAIGVLLISLIHKWTVYPIIPPLPIPEFILEVREFLSSIALTLLLYETYLLTLSNKGNE